MRCVIPSQNVKIIARGIHSLAKIGDEMFIEPTENELIFRTVNGAQSAFVEFKMTKAFFSSYLFNEEDIESSCKITMRSCISVFKSAHIMDKQVESCELRIRPEGTVVIFQLKYGNSCVKKHSLPILESEKLEAVVPDTNTNVMQVTSKFLAAVVKNFRLSEDEITLKVDLDKIFIKNHLELKKDYRFLRTELSFHPSDLEEYSIQNPTAITFCFKELRAVLSFVEPTHLSVQFLFDSPGQPMVIKVTNIPVYELIFVISTLNTVPNNTTKINNTTIRKRNQDPSVDESENLNMPSTSRTKKRNVEQVQESVNPNMPSTSGINRKRPVSTSLIDKIISAESSNSKKRKTNENKTGSIPDDLLVPEVSIKRSYAKEPTNNNFNDIQEELNFTFGNEIFEIPQNVNVIPESTIGSEFNHTFNTESCGIVSEYDKLTSGAFKTSSGYSDSIKSFLRHIFARCYESKNILDTLENHKKVLVNDSEDEV